MHSSTQRQHLYCSAAAASTVSATAANDLHPNTSGKETALEKEPVLLPLLLLVCAQIDLMWISQMNKMNV